jgi:hypothetical protein
MTTLQIAFAAAMFLTLLAWGGTERRGRDRDFSRWR